MVPDDAIAIRSVSDTKLYCSGRVQYNGELTAACTDNGIINVGFISSPAVIGVIIVIDTYNFLTDINPNDDIKIRAADINVSIFKLNNRNGVFINAAILT